MENLKQKSLGVWKGGLPPRWLNGSQPERGQASLPDNELLNLEPDPDLESFQSSDFQTGAAFDRSAIFESLPKL